jgi:hypothetical protein
MVLTRYVVPTFGRLTVYVVLTFRSALEANT